MSKKVVFAIIAVILVLVVVGVALFFVMSDREDEGAVAFRNVNGDEPNELEDEEEEETIVINYTESAEKQMAMPEAGEEIAIMHVRDFGEIKIRFFPEVAPMAVENFITHARNGFYDGLTFHRVIEEFMIQGGCTLGTGTGGESIWGRGFAEEFAEEGFSPVPYRGSLAMASRGLGTNSIGSQFFITQANPATQGENTLRQMRRSEALIEQYRMHGGAMHLYRVHTVFGQVFEGMDVVDRIAAVETGTQDRPLVSVVIDRVEIVNF